MTKIKTYPVTLNGKMVRVTVPPRDDDPETEGGFICAKCGSDPAFTHRTDWGFNMADAYCPKCDSGIFKARD